jgi:hypothetical protein
MKMSQNDTQQNPEKLRTKISDEAERKRREKALDEAIENSFPASDPVSAEQPLHAHGFEIPPITFASDCSAADHRHLLSGLVGGRLRLQRSPSLQNFASLIQPERFGFDLSRCNRQRRKLLPRIQLRKYCRPTIDQRYAATKQEQT